MAWFDNNDRGEQLFAVQTAFLVTAWIFSFLRAWTKIYITKKVLVDDYMMLAAIVRISQTSNPTLCSQPCWREE